MKLTISLEKLSTNWLHKLWAKIPGLDESKARGFREEANRRLALEVTKKLRAAIADWSIE